MSDTDTDPETTGAIPETPPAPAAGAQPNTPAAQANDDTFNQAVGKAGKAIYEGVLSVPQYLSLLMGKAGQYDQIWNNSTVRSIVSAAQATGQALNKPLDSPDVEHPPLQGQGNASPMMQGGLPGVGEGEAPAPGATQAIKNFGKGVSKFGKGLAENTGLADAPYKAPYTPPDMNAPAGAAGNVVSKGYEPQGEGPNWAHPGNSQQAGWNGKDTPSVPQLAQMFDVDPKIVQRALAMHSGNAGFQDPAQRQAMYDYIAKFSGEATKHQQEMEKTRAQSTWRTDNNVRTNATRVQIEQMKDAVTNTKTQSQAMTALQVAAQKNGTAQDKMVVDLVGKYVAASLPPPDDLAAQAHDVLFRAHQGASEGEGGGRGPQQIQTQGNPNANQQFQPPTQQMRGPDGNIHSFVLQNGKYVQQ